MNCGSKCKQGLTAGGNKLIYGQLRTNISQCLYTLMFMCVKVLRSTLAMHCVLISFPSKVVLNLSVCFCVRKLNHVCICCLYLVASFGTCIYKHLSQNELCRLKTRASFLSSIELISLLP